MGATARRKYGSQIIMIVMIGFAKSMIFNYCVLAFLQLGRTVTRNQYRGIQPLESFAMRTPYNIARERRTSFHQFYKQVCYCGLTKEPLYPPARAQAA
jgi:hypothetical protein